MKNALKFYIDGRWVEPHGADRLAVINPATEQPFEEIAMGDLADVESAVMAARRAFPAFAGTTPAQRKQLLQRVLEVFMARYDEIAEAKGMPLGTVKALPLSASFTSNGSPPVGARNCSLCRWLSGQPSDLPAFMLAAWRKRSVARRMRAISTPAPVPRLELPRPASRSRSRRVA